jgi:hypothetical protein
METDMSEHTSEKDAAIEEPNEVGWYAYSGGAQSMIFHLRETGQWSVHLDNGSASDCGWSYIEQALGVWDLVRIDFRSLASAWARGFMTAAPDADPIDVARWNPYPTRDLPPGE